MHIQDGKSSPSEITAVEALVLGGGISGLCVGNVLHNKGVDFLLLEASKRLGGCMGSTEIEGNFFEYGPNTIVSNQTLNELIRDLDLEDKVLRPTSHSKNRYLFHKGSLHGISNHPLTFLTNKIIGFWASLRVFKEVLISSKSPENETVEEFFTRRFGEKFTHEIVASVVQGIYGQHLGDLNMELAFPELLEMEKTHGSIVKGLKRIGVQKREIIGFKGGTSVLIDALCGKMGSRIRLGHSVESISYVSGLWKVEVRKDDEILGFQSKRVFSTLPVHVLAQTLKLDTKSITLKALNYIPMTVGHLRFHPSDRNKLPKGFGFLASPGQGKAYSGLFQNSDVFPENFNGTGIFATLFLAEKDNLKAALAELKKDLNLHHIPELLGTKHYPNALPSYGDHLKLVRKELEMISAEFSGIHFTGNFMGGISVPNTMNHADLCALSCVY